MLNIIISNYRTYLNPATNKPGGHFLRVGIFFAASVLIAIFSNNSSTEIYGMMTTGLTILTGFTFTALFSDHSLADVGLEKPRDETDFAELKRLEKLADNFQSRCTYFITLSIIDVCVLIAISLKFSSPSNIKSLFDIVVNKFGFNSPNMIYWYQNIVDWIFVGIYIFVFFVFLECLYTFYRLSETIIAIVNTRRSYMKPPN